MLDQHVAEEDCYEGYLWAPFDTFLNVARLLQFNRDKMWYHSPFGVPVPNMALEDATKHASPAKISPDPYGNVTKIWRHWGPDWWFVLCLCRGPISFPADTHPIPVYRWGRVRYYHDVWGASLILGFSEPHVGLSVCMLAFEKVPLHMRKHLASLTGNETRLVGGSSDTAYFPREPHVYPKFARALTIFILSQIDIMHR